MTKKELMKKFPEARSIESVNYTGLKIHGFCFEPDMIAFGTDVDGKPFKRTVYTTPDGWDYFMFYGKRQFIKNFIRLDIGA